MTLMIRTGNRARVICQLICERLAEASILVLKFEYAGHRRGRIQGRPYDHSDHFFGAR